MKKASSIVLTYLATAIMLFASVVPHHHHGRTTCFVLEECNGHHGTSKGHDIEDEELCVIKGNLLTSKTSYNNAFDLLKFNPPIYLNFFVFHFHNINLIDYLESNKKYKPYIYPKKTIQISFIKGQRAPPYLLI